MAKKALNVRIHDETVDRLKYYCAELRESEADFMAAAIEHYCDELRHQRSGGMSLSIPNPQNFIASEEQKTKAIEILSMAADQIIKECGGSLEFGLHYITGYAVQRLCMDNAEQKEDFKSKLGKDI